MAELWSWLAVAGFGALHGLSPANGWALAAACGVQAGDGAAARRALRPMACGQVAAMAALAGALSLGLSVDRALVRDLAGTLLIGAAACAWLRGAGRSARLGTGSRHACLALGSFLMASAQGAGLMLVPALVPLCAAGTPVRELAMPGPLAMALAAVGVHTAAMLLSAGLLATGVCRGVALRPRLLRGTSGHRAWIAALAVTGVGLLAFA